MVSQRPHSFSISSVAGYTLGVEQGGVAAGAHGSANLSSKNVLFHVRFSPALFAVTFNESGLGGGTVWHIRALCAATKEERAGYDGMAAHSRPTGSRITLWLRNGTYLSKSALFPKYEAWVYNPDMMHPPNPANAGKCTMQQAMDYAACEGGQTAKCSEFGVGQPAQDCGECIETQYTDKTWGVVVFQNSIGTINREGCVDDALSEVSEEHASGGKGSCGDLLYASYGCQDVVCGTCVGDDLTTCDETAIETQCEGYDKAVENTSGPCAELFGDAAPPASTSCFPNTSITDLASQQTDYLTRIVQYMCGTN